jgi:hypothetical protein
MLLHKGIVEPVKNNFIYPVFYGVVAMQFLLLFDGL